MNQKLVSQNLTPQPGLAPTLTHTFKISDPAALTANSGKKMILMRQVIGEELRRRRTEQSRTLRDVSRDAQVSLGYLSELERGQKEASSELLAAVCNALDTPLSALLLGVSQEVARREMMIARRNEFAKI
jgi:predicted transcriptional regulator